MVVHTLSPDLMKLIDAIEAWPSAVSAIQKSVKPRTHSIPAAGSSGAIEAAEDGGDGEEEEEEEEFATRRAGPPPRLNVKLTSSLRAQATHRMSSMASAVPQRQQDWRHSALGPSLGPGSYATTVEGCEVRDLARKSHFYRSDAPARAKNLGLVGEPPAPDGMFANTTSPRKPYAQLHGANPFQSCTYRFGADAHLKGLVLQQKRAPPHRAMLTPQWTDAPEQLVIPADHAERLAAARASIKQQP